MTLLTGNLPRRKAALTKLSCLRWIRLESVGSTGHFREFLVWGNGGKPLFLVIPETFINACEKLGTILRKPQAGLWKQGLVHIAWPSHIYSP